MPVSFSTSFFNVVISATGRLDFKADSRRSSLRGLMQIPLSVTMASTVSPGVVTVVTLSFIEGMPPLKEGTTTIESFAPATVS